MKQVKLETLVKRKAESEGWIDYITTNADIRAANEGCYVNKHSGQRCISWCETFLVDPKSRQQFKFLSWQKEVVMQLLSWFTPDGRHRFRRGSIWVPKRNGKDFMLSALVNYFLFVPVLYGWEERNPRIYAAATALEQAGIIFEYAAKMIGPELTDMGLVSTNAKYRRISAGTEGLFTSLARAYGKDAGKYDGLDASLVIVDELHRHSNDKLWKILQYAIAARENGLLLSISTAGDSIEHFSYAEYSKAQAIIDGSDTQTSYYAYVRAAPINADWNDDNVLRASNPICETLPFFLSDLRDDRDKAKKGLLADECNFRQLRLNQWVAKQTGLFDMQKWDACNDMFDPKTLQHQIDDKTGNVTKYGPVGSCGVDLSRSKDVTSIVLMFPDGVATDENTAWNVLTWFYLPADGLRDRCDRDGIPWDDWVDQGFVTLCKGDVIDHTIIEAKLQEIWNTYNIPCLGFDRYRMDLIYTRLLDAGIRCEALHQTYQVFDRPTRHLERLTQKKLIRTNNNPVLRYMASCTDVDRQETTDLIKPTKRTRNAKKDGIDCMVMALEIAVRQNINNNEIFSSEFQFFV